MVTERVYSPCTAGGRSGRGPPQSAGRSACTGQRGGPSPLWSSRRRGDTADTPAPSTPAPAPSRAETQGSGDGERL